MPAKPVAPNATTSAPLGTVRPTTAALCQRAYQRLSRVPGEPTLIDVGLGLLHRPPRFSDARAPRSGAREALRWKGDRQDGVHENFTRRASHLTHDARGRAGSILRRLHRPKVPR